MPNPKKQRVCEFCQGVFFFQGGRVRKFCSNACRNRGSDFPSKEEMAKRGMLNPATQRKRRFAQIELEESIANSLREGGWEIFSPTVSLRPGQKRVQDCASGMYRVVTHPKCHE